MSLIFICLLLVVISFDTAVLIYYLVIPAIRFLQHADAAIEITDAIIKSIDTLPNKIIISDIRKYTKVIIAEDKLTINNKLYHIEILSSYSRNDIINCVTQIVNEVLELHKKISTIVSDDAIIKSRFKDINEKFYELKKLEQTAP